MNKKKGLIIIASLLLSFSFVPLSANTETEEDILETSSTNETFITVDKDGNFTEVSMDDLEKETQQENQEKWRAMLSREAIGGTRNITNGVVNFKTKNSSTINTTYTIEATGQTGYTNGYYGADAAFLGYTSLGQVRFMQSGVIGIVNANEVEILDYDDESSVKSVNFYRSEGGRIYHYGTNNVKSSYYWLVNDIGPQQSYMKSNTVYYSYDGHYFYTTYAAMIKDYQNNTRSNSINANSPYFNYYQFLSHRSKTNFTASDLDNWLLTKTSSTTSKMRGLGNSFIEYQNTYGANAVLMYGVAINESGYGNSSIAQAKNNLFGHGAVDSNPYYGASGYSSASNSVLYHAKVFISEGYLDPCDGGNTYGNGYSSSVCLKGRYYGAHLGDKASGINVKYASDPYWGEKAARVGWELEKYKGYKNVDNAMQSIAIKEDNYVLNVRKSANSSSALLYQAPKNSNIPFLVLSEVQGESVNGSTLWYKVQSDPTLDATGSKLIQDSGQYAFSTNVGYIHSSYVTLVTSGTSIGGNTSGGNSSGGDSSGTTQTPSTSVAVKGDVNGDSKVTSVDYLMIKDSIMGKTTLNATQKGAADVNGDSKVSSPDYLMIKDYIMGKIKL